VFDCLRRSQQARIEGRRALVFGDARRQRENARSSNSSVSGPIQYPKLKY
jgi:hypothetical protein